MLSGAWPHILHSGIEAFQPALCAVACPLQIARWFSLKSPFLLSVRAHKLSVFLTQISLSKSPAIGSAISKCKNEITTRQGSSLCTSLLAQDSAAAAACCRDKSISHQAQDAHMTHSASTAVMPFPLGPKVRSSDEHTPENVI